VSPRASTTNLGETSGRLSSLAEAESPTSERARASNDVGKDSHDGTNGVKAGGDAAGSSGLQKTPSNLLNGTPEDIFDAPPPPGPPPGHKPLAPTSPTEQTDADGFTVPPARSDPISEAQREAAAEESDQLFSLKIANKPVVEEDAAEKQAALSNVANALGQMSVPSRRGGTVRGRRDVRNTIYIPAGLPVGESTSSVTGSASAGGSALSAGATSPPSLGGSTPKLSTVSQLASEGSMGGSDSQSVRSGVSLGSLAHLRHPDLTGPGLSTSVIESVSATFEEGAVATAKVNGEIAFAYVRDEGNSNCKSPDFPFPAFFFSGWLVESG
jgi:F-BAR domain only protein